MIKINGRAYRNMQEQVCENANNIEELKNKNPRIYHKCTLTYNDGSDVTVDFHIWHYLDKPLSKDQFIEYIKKVKLINLDFSAAHNVSNYYPMSINWPIDTQDNLMINQIYVDSNGDLDWDVAETSTNYFTFTDEVINF